MDKSLKYKMWSEKYKPTSIDDYIFTDENLEQQVHKFIATNTIPNLLFSGVQGTGKSTLSDLIVKALGVDEMDLLVIRASDENNVETMREKIKNFAIGYPMGDRTDFKVVQLEEMEYLSMNAQAILRHLMEGEYLDTCRFICTCNYDNKIMPALKSRLQHFEFKAHDIEGVMLRVANILVQEEVEFSIDVLDKYVSAYYPDIRKILNTIQPNVDGNSVLCLPKETNGSDYKFQILELLETNNFTEMRKIVCANASREDFESVYRFLYENLHKSPKFKTQSNYEAGIVSIANYLYKHSIVADPEINIAALFIELGRV